MRQFLGAFLLLVFVVNLIGIFIVFELQRMRIRNEVIQLLEQHAFANKIVVITPSKKTPLEWKNKNEFRYAGRMYDVVKKENNANGEPIFYCIADHKETELEANL